jgi:predicted acetyltransferase
VAIEIRPPAEDELRAGMEAAESAFGSSLEEVDWERESVSLRPERAVVALDGARTVGLAGSYEFELTVPGGQLPCAGVTWVGVVPTHRRQGILRGFMKQQLDVAREHSEPIAALWASEAAIYGRFGYGMAAPAARLTAESKRFALRDDPGPQGSLRLVDAAEAYELARPVHDRLRRERPGMITRSEHWWRKHRLADHESWRRGASQKFFAVLELDGAVEGYAIYRIKSEWEQGFPHGVVRVHEAFGTSPVAEREIWRYLFSIDLTEKVDAGPADPSTPLFLMVRDPRALHLKVDDGLWLRLVDVEAALSARSYRDGEPVVLDVRDELCPWNAGRYRVGERVERTDEAPDVELDVADLASAYLGAFDFLRLASADRARELAPGGLERASELFRTALPPYCPEVF